MGSQMHWCVRSPHRAGRATGAGSILPGEGRHKGMNGFEMHHETVGVSASTLLSEWRNSRFTVIPRSEPKLQPGEGPG